MENNDKNVIQLAFAAIDPTLTGNIPVLEESEARGKDYILYGSDNLYPNYLRELYLTVSTLKSVIDGTTDFVVGDSIAMDGVDNKIVNGRGDTVRDLITLIAKDYLIYGGFCVQVVRNNLGKVSELYYVDFRYVRSDKDNNVFYYSEEFDKKWVRSNKVVVYPKFSTVNPQPSSLVYVKNSRSTTYPIPRYSGAVKGCEIERHIDGFHLNGLENGFYGSYVLSFNNGLPTDEQRMEIEKNVMEKFCGAANSGRVLLNFSDSKDNAVTVDKLDVVDFSEKYQAAAERAREQIFTSFRATPILFGLTSTTNTGFSTDEFQQTFRLYNRTVVRPLQQLVSDTFDKVYERQGVLKIKPFSIEEDNNGEKTVE